MRKIKPSITAVRPAGDDHQVVTVEGGSGTHRRKPCGGCPWVMSNAGAFPAEAFGHSAGTAYDMATHVFACHESGANKPSICAGFLLRGADHNLAVRLKAMRGKIDLGAVADGGKALFESYRSMAVANGLDPQDPRLAQCRP